MRPAISVQIPVRNGGDSFRECLGSLMSQDTGGTPWELVVVDDGSEIPVRKEFDLSHPSEVSIRVVRREGSGSRPEARNEGWKAASAPLSLLADGDTAFGPGVIAGHIRAHREGIADVVMGARVNAWAEDATPWERWFDSRGMGGRPSGPFPARYFVTGNVSLPTSVLERAGGFDPAIDRYGGEDTEFGFRLARMNVSLHWDPGLRVRHLDRVTARQHSRKMVEYGGSGLRYTLRKIPESEGLLGSTWVKPLLSRPRSPAAVGMRLIVRIVLNPPVYRLVLRWMERVGRPSFLFTCLSVGGCLLGLSGRGFERRE